MTNTQNNSKLPVFLMFMGIGYIAIGATHAIIRLISTRFECMADSGIMGIVWCPLNPIQYTADIIIWPFRYLL